MTVTPDKLERWRGFVPDDELDTYRKGGFARRIGIALRKQQVENAFRFMLRRDGAAVAIVGHGLRAPGRARAAVGGHHER